MRACRAPILNRIWLPAVTRIGARTRNNIDDGIGIGLAFLSGPEGAGGTCRAGALWRTRAAAATYFARDGGRSAGSVPQFVTSRTHGPGQDPRASTGATR